MEVPYQIYSVAVFEKYKRTVEEWLTISYQISSVSKGLQRERRDRPLLTFELGFTAEERSTVGFIAGLSFQRSKL